MKTVGIVGAGVIGACLAFSLTQRGMHVHCVERAEAGGLTTDVSFARMSAVQQPTYARFELSHTGMIEHLRFAEQFDSAPWWHPTGSLAWADDEGTGGPSFADVVRRLESWGYRTVRTDAARVNRDWEPGIAFPDARAPIVRFPDEGWIDGPRLVSEMLAAAGATGRLELWHGTVDGIEVDGGEVRALRLESGDRVEVDAVVNAAGPGAPEVAATLGNAPLGGVAKRSSLVIDLLTDGDPVRHVLRGAQAHARSAGPGRVRVRSDQIDALLPADPAADPDDALVKDLLERAYRTVPALESATVDRVRLATAVFPGDGFPSLGALSAVSGYYEAFANSGITLAPFIGRTLTTHIATGEIHPMWAHCSPDRLRSAS